MTVLLMGGQAALDESNAVMSTPFLFVDNFTRADAASPGNGWSDLNDLWPNSYDLMGIDDNALAATSSSAINGGNGCVYREFGVSTNFHIRCTWLPFQNDPPLESLNQNGPAIFINPTAPYTDLHQGIVVVSDFTLSFGNTGAYYFNNIANEDAQTYGVNYETHSELYGSVEFFDHTLFTQGQTPYSNYPLPFNTTNIYDVWVVGSQMQFAVNGIRSAVVTVPSTYVGRTIHGLYCRTGAFPISKVFDHFSIEPCTEFPDS